jgi:hypothetical protein
MTAVEHIIYLDLQNSQPEYKRLCDLERYRKSEGPERNGWLAFEAYSIAASAYRQMVKGGDAYMGRA